MASERSGAGWPQHRADRDGVANRGGDYTDAMRLPNGHQAIVAIEKLTDYCLNPHHPRGRHKARVFEAALGIRQVDAPQLRDLLLEAARNGEASVGLADASGQRFTIDFAVRTAIGADTIRSHWIIRAGETAPRLTTCFVR